MSAQDGVMAVFSLWVRLVDKQTNELEQWQHMVSDN